MRFTEDGPAVENCTSGSVTTVRKEIKSAVRKTMLDWLQMRSFNPEKESGSPDYVIILADEISAMDFDTRMNTSKAIALLPSHMTRARTESLLAQRFDIYQTITAPFGPRKLARAIAACEEIASRRKSSPKKTTEPHNESSGLENAGTSPDPDPPQHKMPLTIQHNSMNPVVQSQWTDHPQELVAPKGTISRQAGSHIFYAKQKSHSSDPSVSANRKENSPSGNMPNGTTGLEIPATRGSGRLLLVDDNKINLSLLETFVKRQKRKLSYDSAENGLLAVEAFQQNPSGYDIIFMDVSMPVMDGLEATREIRKLEKERITEFGEAAAPPPALIIALTGLANGRDQVDAFASGVNLFMTKPTKFKEIGTLIENWYQNGPDSITA
jgi:CheY-like chemotaxis protein